MVTFIEFKYKRQSRKKVTLGLLARFHFDFIILVKLTYSSKLFPIQKMRMFSKIGYSENNCIKFCMQSRSYFLNRLSVMFQFNKCDHFSEIFETFYVEKYLSYVCKNPFFGACVRIFRPNGGVFQL